MVSEPTLLSGVGSQFVEGEAIEFDILFAVVGSQGLERLDLKVVLEQAL